MKISILKHLAAAAVAAACSGCAGLQAMVDNGGIDPSDRTLTPDEVAAQERHLAEFYRTLEEDLQRE